MTFPEPTAKTAQKRPFWQYLVAPMLVISVGLHGALLLLPTGASDDEWVPAPDPEEDGIAITRSNAVSPLASNPASSPTSSPTSPAVNSSAKTNPPQRNPASNNSSTARSGGAAGSRGNRSSTSSRASGTRASGTRTSGTGASGTGASEFRQPSSAESSSNAAATRSNPSASSRYPTSDPLAPVLDYFAVFETYRGTVPVDTEEIEALKDLWLTGLKEAGVPLAEIEPDDIQPLTNLDQIPYPAAICLPQPPAIAQLLVLVAADGTPNPDIFPLRDTGYTSFDDQAETIIRNHDFPKQDAPVAYLVDVAVAYDGDNCQWPRRRQ
ncbi:MAG: hypothetical protein HC812_11210, partial [Leptolyngbya sp. RL_3_1]|nr:hypothetical protein [Leptolyngbya sp. RL_3_1]